jgi:hypothetical protein
VFHLAPGLFFGFKKPPSRNPTILLKQTRKVLMPNGKPMNVSIQNKAGICLAEGHIADEWNVNHAPKILLRFCYCPEKPEGTNGQLKRLLACKEGKEPVSIFIGRFAFRNLFVADLGFSVDGFDGSGSPVLSRVMVAAEAHNATTKEDLPEIYP